MFGKKRGGEGGIVSSDEAKEGLGRTSFRRPRKGHTGGRSDETAWKAEQNVDAVLNSTKEAQRQAKLAQIRENIAKGYDAAYEE